MVFATLAASLLLISGGINMGQTAVLLPQLENDKTFPYDKTLDSWIASFGPLAMIAGSLSSGSVSDWIGRKITQMILSITFTIGWIIMGFSYNNSLILTARFITGVCFGASMSCGMVFIEELADPEYRAISLICPSLSIHIGNLISHTVGKYVYWKYSCFIYVMPSLTALLILMFLKESPLWLLSKGKRDEGIESFTFYRGNTETSEKELTAIIQRSNVKPTHKELLREIFNVSFVKILLTTFLLFVAAHWCGVNTIPYYAVYIFQKTFSDIDVFSFTIISDCLRIVVNVGICIFSKFVPRRLFFLICCFITSIVLGVIAIYVHLRPTGLLWIAFTCTIIYIGTGTALTSISYSTVAEIFPTNLRGFGVGLGFAIAFILLFISVKVTPEIIEQFSEIAFHGTLALLTLFSGTCLIFMLPDTNSRTLQDIEDSLYNTATR